MKRAIGYLFTLVIAMGVVALLAQPQSKVQHQESSAFDLALSQAVERLEGKVFEGTIQTEQLAEMTARHRDLSRMVATPSTVRVKIFSEGGPPAAEFHPATGILEDAYFSLVGEAGGRA